MKKDCKEIHEIEKDPKQESAQWSIFMVETSENKNEMLKENLELAVDSGTEVHIIPLKWVSKLMKWINGPDITMRGAGGEYIRHLRAS